MRLIDPGPGEILDRLCILHLKIVHKRLEGRETKHWLDEALQLIAHPRYPEVHARPLLQLLELAAVNAALWQAEDELRALRTQPVTWCTPDRIPIGTAGQVARVAVSIQALNDRRADLVAQINTLAGIERPEK